MTNPDKKRLGVQREDVLALMLDGIPRTFEEIQREIQGRTGRRHPEASISARLRDLRHDGYEVAANKRRGNLWQYRVAEKPRGPVQIGMFESGEARV